MTNNEPKLLPCPFCGSDDVSLANRNWFVECNNCAMEGPWNGDYDASKATSDWNTRAAQNVSAALPERKRESNEDSDVLIDCRNEGFNEMRDLAAPVYAERDALKAALAEMTTYRDNAANHMRRIRAEATVFEKERDAAKAELEALLAKGKVGLPERMDWEFSDFPDYKTKAQAHNKCLDAVTPAFASLRAENERLIQDRARFPDRPDDIGRMIGSHMESMKRRAESAEGSLRWRHHEIHTLRTERDQLKALLRHARDLYRIPESFREGLLSQIDAALADEAPKS